MNKTIFFDRDGVVNYRPVGDYVKSPSEFHFVADFPEYFIKIKQQGCLAIIISNQQGVGKGLMSETDLNDIHNYMQKEVYKLTGYRFDDAFYCFDLKDSGSTRRKPEPGMLIEAIEKWDIDIENSYMIGDSVSDVIAGKRAGVKTIFLSSDVECEDADFNVKSLLHLLLP